MIPAYLFLVLCLLYFSIQLVTWIGLIRCYTADGTLAAFPQVSILLAARNEEQHIVACLKAINELDYPKDKLDVWIGDDQSDDDTAILINRFIEDKPHMHYYRVTNNLGKARGKANVLAQLAHEAKGDYFFITDADIEVNSGWIKGMLAAFTPGCGLISGVTFGQGKGLLQQMQVIDWTYFMSMLAGITKAGLPCTAVGNNMAVTRAAYFSTGGYEHMDYSVTEDYKLFKAVKLKGWFTKNIFTPGTYHFTEVLPDYRAILHQRKRWLTGGQELPLVWKIMLGTYGLFMPVLLFTFFLHPVLAFAALLIKLFFEALILNTTRTLIKRKPMFTGIFIYQFYALVLNLSMLFFYYLPFSFQWKNRPINK